jgi:hypothetical protein
MMVFVLKVQDSNPAQYLAKRKGLTSKLSDAREYPTYAMAVEATYCLNLNPQIVDDKPIMFLGQVYSKPRT